MDDWKCHCGLEASIRVDNDIYQCRYARCPKMVRDLTLLTLFICSFTRFFCDGTLCLAISFLGWSCLWLLRYGGPPIHWTVHACDTRACGRNDWSQGFMVGQPQCRHVGGFRGCTKSCDDEWGAEVDEDVGMCRSVLFALLVQTWSS